MSELHMVFLILSVMVVLFDSCYAAVSNKKDLLITVEYRPEQCDKFAEDGDKITVEYTGYLESGIMFDSTTLPERGPLNFTLGTNTVIPGLERGIIGMCNGEKRKLVIPSHLAYGNQGYRTIPGDSTIYFDVQLTMLNKKSVLDKTVNAIHFFFYPLTTSLVIFYLWHKMNSAGEVPSVSPSGKDKKSKRKNRKRSKRGRDYILPGDSLVH